jgi:hypothetical protein
MPAVLANTALAINGTDAQLIWELVAEISSPAEVLARYGLTPADLKAKNKDKMFRAAYQEARNLWKSDLNAEDRIKVKARAMVEDGLVDIFQILKNIDGVPQLRLEAFEKLMKVGDLGPKKDKESGTKPFSIVMQFSNTEKKVVIDGHTLEHSESN